MLEFPATPWEPRHFLGGPHFHRSVPFSLVVKYLELHPWREVLLTSSLQMREGEGTERLGHWPSVTQAEVEGQESKLGHRFQSQSCSPFILQTQEEELGSIVTGVSLEAT